MEYQTRIDDCVQIRGALYDLKMLYPRGYNRCLNRLLNSKADHNIVIEDETTGNILGFKSYRHYDLYNSQEDLENDIVSRHAMPISYSVSSQNQFSVLM
jgi:hypothetical protein